MDEKGQEMKMRIFHRPRAKKAASGMHSGSLPLLRSVSGWEAVGSHGTGRLWILFSCFLVIALGLHCVPAPNMRGPQQLEATYEHQLQIWTKSSQIYDSLDSILLTHVTYISPDFRSSFINQYVKIFGVDPGNDSELEKVATAPDEEGHLFFVFADSAQFEWNNLDSSESVWRLALWGSKSKPGVAPISIKQFYDRGPNLRAFFPFLTQFGKSYLVSFPKNHADGNPILDPEEKVITLRMASAFGSVALAWKVVK
jgi:hypothetical protein